MIYLPSKKNLLSYLPMIYLPSKKKTYFPTYLWSTCLVKNLLSYLSTYVYDLLSYQMGLPRWNPILTHLIDVSLGGPFPEEVKHRTPYKRWFSPLRFILLKWKGRPPAEARGQMDYFFGVPFVFSLVFGLMCFDRIGSFGTNEFNDSYTLLRKILNLVVQGGLVNHESQKYGHLRLTKWDKTCIMTKPFFLFFFPPY
jgi:hypothetical protein